MCVPDYDYRTCWHISLHVVLTLYVKYNRFQAALRQMVYLAIKELASSAENMIMVTSSIMKDIQPNLEVIYRPNAIRALCRVIDVSHV